MNASPQEHLDDPSIAVASMCQPDPKHTLPDLYIECQVRSTRTGMSFLMGMVRSDGGSILKSVSLVGIVPVIWVSFPCTTRWNGTCLYSKVWPGNWTSRSRFIVGDVDAASGTRVRTVTM